MQVCSFNFYNGYSSRISYKPTIVVITYVLLSGFLPMGDMSTAALAQICNVNKYMMGSAFEKNLNMVLQYLANNASEIGFNTSSYGKRPNEVFGLLQCRGDLNRKDCENCSIAAVMEIRKTCPKAIGALAWFDACFLRYENQNFLSGLDSPSIVSYYCNNDIAPNSYAFGKTLKKLLFNLANEASIPTHNGFVTGKEVDSSDETIYGLVQCFRDLSHDNCTKCISDAILGIPDNCYAKRGGQVFLRSCYIRYETFKFFYSPAPLSEKTPALAPSNSMPAIKHSSRRLKPYRLVIIVAVVGGALLASIICFFKFKASDAFKSITHCEEAHEDHSEELPKQEQIIFSLQTLKVATGKFHSDNKLGEGGFGPVYKGRLPDGREIAVKKLSVRSRQGRIEFMNEVKIVAKIQHRNLVKLIGCCAAGIEKLLVYEYMPNRSLDKILFDRKRCTSLDWQRRHNIILGIARGLLYLHEDSQLRIIHRDIKASNILLDEKLNPKISDFGMARLFPGDQIQFNTKIAGTYGYMAPEYAMQGQLSVRADIFSFGVLLLEILSGRKNTDYSLPPDMQILLVWAWRLYRKGKALDIMDSALGGSWYSEEQVLRCIHIGLLCTQADASARPPMSSIFLMLSTSSVELPDPTKPGFVSVIQSSTNSIQKDGLSGTSAVSSASSHSPLVADFSRNDISITEVEGR